MHVASQAVRHLAPPTIWEIIYILKRLFSDKVQKRLRFYVVMLFVLFGAEKWALPYYVTLCFNFRFTAEETLFSITDRSSAASFVCYIYNLYIGKTGLKHPRFLYLERLYFQITLRRNNSGGLGLVCIRTV